ncbi:MAG: ABC transporter ATP-binding protein [Pseudomonadota bacterium]
MPQLPQPGRDFAPWNDPAAEPLITFDRVTKRFGDVTAVDDLTLNIYPREFFALLGASGCGKTTLLRMLAGFEAPTAGQILLDGEDISRVPAHKRPVNMMFQSYALFPHMTVAQNIAYGLRQQGASRADADARVEEMLTLVQLKGLGRRKPDQLSGGQRQRVALARALAKAPRLLLLDEPLGALDKKLRVQTQFELMDLQEQTGTTFVMVTHDQEEAMTMADRVAVMTSGRIAQVAPPGELYEYPNSRYVADFIGDVNIFAGTLITDAQAAQFKLASGTTLATDAPEPARRSAPGEAVWLAIRPEKIRTSKNRDEHPGENKLPGTVLDIAYLGDVTIYHVETAEGIVVKALEANRSRLVDRAITWNDAVWLTWPASGGVLVTT